MPTTVTHGSHELAEHTPPGRRRYLGRLKLFAAGRSTSMRWWLALTFGAIAALTAVAMATLAERRAEDAVRDRARTLALGNAVQAAIDIGAAEPSTRRSLVARVAAERKIALFLVDARGRLVSMPTSHGVAFGAVPLRDKAIATALDGHRFVETNAALRGTTIGLRLGGGASTVVVGYARHPDLAAGLGIFRREAALAAAWAVMLASTVGVLVALLLARRIRRIANAAAAIEAGDFEAQLRSGVGDELGQLATTIDRMRRQLRSSFGALESERDRLRHVVERLREAVVAVDAAHRVEFANPAATVLLGATEGEWLREPWPEFSLHGFVGSLFQPGATPIEARVSASGDRTYVITGVPARDPADTAVVVVVDVSESERQELAQRHFVANAAHELRAPLTGILTTVEVLRAGATADPRVADEFLANIEGEAERLARLTRALLVLARAEAHQEASATGVVEVEPLLRRVAGDVVTRTGVDVRVWCDAAIRTRGDGALVEQAVSSVAANAAAHTSDGRIDISAFELGQESIVIEVEDTGSGIAEPDHERVFDRFYRGSNGDGSGFGLGLAIARQAVHVLGGRIGLRSEVGVGTTVRILLPRSDEQ